MSNDLASVVPARRRGWMAGVSDPTTSAFIFLLALVAFFGLSTPRHAFIGLDNLSNISVDVAAVAIVVIGQTFVMIMAGIDLSVGAVLVLSSVVAGQTIGWLGGAPVDVAIAQDLYPNAAFAVPAGILAGIAVGVVCGAINGTIIAYTRVPPFIVTLGMLGVALGVANLRTGGVNVSTVPSFMQEFVNGNVAGIPVLTIIALVLVAAGHVLLAYTKFGRYVYAIGSGPTVARRAGIPVRRCIIAAYTLSGTLAAMTGVLDLARFRDAMVSGYALLNLDTVSAAVIGGVSLFGARGNIPGAVLGALIIAVLLNGFVVLGLPSFWQMVVTGVVIVLAVYVDELRQRKGAAR